MLLHQQFVRVAKKYEKKLAIIDKTLNKRLTYKKALIGSLMLSKKFEKYDPKNFTELRNAFRSAG